LSNEKILLIEDELKIARFIELELKYEGYIVTKEHDGRAGLEKALNENYDLIILDVMLPSLNGMEVLRRLRQTKDTAVIMLTAKDEIMDKVQGLDLGADDYMTKPFAIEELLARIRVALKRNKSTITEVYTTIKLNNLTINLDKYSVSYLDQNIDLTKKEYDLLLFLAQNKNIVLSREKILEVVWGYDYLGDTNVVDVYIRYLRSKIDDNFNIKLIYTIRGVGYVLKHE
jgi:Response regulators consisting of a CheY-like receiver domain and a winged-helix DNA-binding domain